MIWTKRYIGTILLIAASLVPLGTIGCAARVYDGYHSDYHRWNDREERAYRIWLAERRYEYREYARLTEAEQHEYWNWRHNHPDAGR